MFEAQPVEFPSREAVAATYLRSRHPGVPTSRTFPATISAFAVAVTDDGGPDRGHLSDNRLRIRVRGKGDEAHSQEATEALANQIAASLRVWHLNDPHIAAVGAVRGPWAVNEADSPPEHLMTVEATFLGTTTT